MTALASHEKSNSPYCGKCGHVRVLNTRNQLYCRVCKLEGAGWHEASVQAWAVENHGPTTLPTIEKTATEMFDEMCEVHFVTGQVTRLHPFAGKLKAGQSLYSRRQIAR